MERVIVINDFLREPKAGLENHPSNRRWLAALVRAQLRSAYSVEEVGSDIDADLKIDVAVYYECLNASCTKEGWAAVMDSQGSPSFDAALADLFNDCRLVIGFGIPNLIAFTIDRLGLPFLDFEVSPLRFLKELTFDLRTNINALQSCGFLDNNPAAADAAAVSIIGRAAREVQSTIPRGAGKVGVIFGQTSVDAALIHEGRIASFDQFESEIQTWSADLDHILFRPHPYAEDTSSFGRIKSILPSTRATLVGSYQLLASQRVDVALALSSGIIDEAPFFGVKAQRLFQPPRRRTDFHYAISAGIESFTLPVVSAIIELRQLPTFVKNTLDVRAQLGIDWGYDEMNSPSDFLAPPEINDGKFVSRVDSELKFIESRKAEELTQLERLQKQIQLGFKFQVQRLI